MWYHTHMRVWSLLHLTWPPFLMFIVMNKIPLLKVPIKLLFCCRIVQTCPKLALILTAQSATDGHVMSGCLDAQIKRFSKKSYYYGFCRITVFLWESIIVIVRLVHILYCSRKKGLIFEWIRCGWLNEKRAF